ncbi:3-oxoacyl-[acyl-carrier protein] reductase [Tenacibaculum sp. MAR_2009_124]|uniref:SDR family NAD(P)-dependent oxidoreductase n=1 Tax=Tenacibaculum sp. MAR_2009_124 TaxID=1250059 RepID=UPI0008972DC7|nr:SDR family NAD(P)-dependent oxidoreductase [Tenacibaculum sp. MAR_2009_124]SEB35016.1 3-oxoacyl-[acyl-carrier protein] reductase [Tenacibaculum sp. MAR_2009_124]
MNKFALITGASRGIGKAISHYFAAQGYSLILIARQHDNLIKLKSELHKNHQINKIKIVSLDFNIPLEVESKINTIMDHNETIDVVVNNAGILLTGNTTLSAKEITQLMNVNLISNMIISNIAAEKMKEQGYGEIYNLGSMAGLEPSSKIAAYAASKAAFISYSESLYHELLAFNIQVCCLCPSVVDTDMTNDGRISNELKIETLDLTKAIDFVRSLSSGASISKFPIRCKLIDLEKK